jgi:hypothetical protein
VENAQLNPHAYRFEKHVYEKLKKLRNPLVFWRREWNGITHADLRGTSDEALVNLATSFGYTQIMGWWAIPLRISVRDIRDPLRHLEVAVRLLRLTAGVELKMFRFGNTLRIWNTGRPNGKTYDPLYVQNALDVMEEYKRLRLFAIRKTDSPRTATDAPLNPPPGSPANSP